MRYIVKPKSNPKSKSQIQVPNPSPKSRSQIQAPNLSPKSRIKSPEEREWDWGWQYNPTGHPPHPPVTFLTWNVNPVLRKALCVNLVSIINYNTSSLLLGGSSRSRKKILKETDIKWYCVRKVIGGWWWWRPVGLYCQSQSQSLSSGLWILDFGLGLGTWIWDLDLDLGLTKTRVTWKDEA